MVNDCIFQSAIRPCVVLVTVAGLMTELCHSVVRPCILVTTDCTLQLLVRPCVMVVAAVGLMAALCQSTK